MKIFGYLALSGNIVFVLWIVYNAIDDGFKATPVELISSLGLVILLILNFILVYNAKINT